jgi:hypothetical protein
MTRAGIENEREVRVREEFWAGILSEAVVVDNSGEDEEMRWREP